MPEKKHYNLESGRFELFNSDYLVCSVCGHTELEDKINELHLSGEEEEDLIKVCKNCGNKVKLFKSENEKKDKYISQEEHRERKKRSE